MIPSSAPPPGFNGVVYAPGISEMIALLNLIAGDPQQVDKAIFFEQGTVVDTAVTVIGRVQARAENYSILQIQFSSTSGLGRWLCTGADPSAAGFGMPILSGGAFLEIRGVDNIENFKMIAETGQTMQYNALLYKAQRWMAQRV
jgi:hypothetical protein